MPLKNIATETSQPDPSNQIIQGLWIGSALSVMEKLSITSFLRNGHTYHLYTYDDLQGVPAGTVIKNGNEILPASAIFQYKNRPSYAGFANYFRYKLLVERGGWWADSDVVCLRPFDFRQEYVFSTEMNAGQQIVNCGVIKAPRGSEVMAYAWRECQSKQPRKLVWGETGPRLICEAVKKHDLEKFQKPYYIFCPISAWHKLLEPYVAAVHPQAYAIHLWNEAWRVANQDKNSRYHPNCIYERLKNMYLEGEPTQDQC